MIIFINTHAHTQTSAVAEKQQKRQISRKRINHEILTPAGFEGQEHDFRFTVYRQQVTTIRYDSRV